MDLSPIAVDTFEPSWVNVIYPAATIVAIVSVVMLLWFLATKGRGQRLASDLPVHVQIFLLGFVLVAASVSLGYHFIVREPDIRFHERSCQYTPCLVRQAANREVAREVSFALVSVALGTVSWRIGRSLRG